MELFLGLLALCVLGMLVGILNRKEEKYSKVLEYFKGYSVEGGEDKGVKYIRFQHVMMLDWDIPDAVHPEEAVSIQTREEVLTLLTEYCMEEKNTLFRVYRTPGGVRGFLISSVVEGPKAQKEVMERLKCDPLYVKFCVLRNTFACRVSPKIGRANDYVARPWTTIGYGKECPLVMETVRYHDSFLIS